MNFASYLPDLAAIGPELVVSGTILVVLLVDLWRMGRDEALVWLVAPLMTVLICLGLFVVGREANESGPDRPYSLLPEFLGVAGAYALVTIGDVWFRGRDRWVPGAVLLLGTSIALYRLILQGGTVFEAGPGLQATYWGSLITIDGFSVFFRALALLSLAVCTFFTIFYRPMQSGEGGKGHGEFLTCLAGAHLGAMFLVSTTHLLFIFLSLEVLSLSSYLQSGMLKDDRRSAEAGLKYVIYGSMASGLMLFGFSLLYAFSGELTIHAIADYVVATEFEGPEKVLLTLGLLASLGGFAYKISAVPFHFWTPDVYEGSPTPTTAFLSVGSKAASFGILIRFLAYMVEDEGWMPKLMALMAFVSAITMTYGNLAALRQSNLKRLMAYSSIAHAGYMLMGIVALAAGYPTVIFYLVAYMLMNLGAFGVIIYLANRTGSEDIDDIRGLGWKAPFVTGTLVVFLLSLVGLPPTAGFFAKYYLFYEAINAGFLWLAVIAVINSVISLFYYFRMAKALFLRFEDEAFFELPRNYFLAGCLFVLAFLTVWIGVFPDEIHALAKEAAGTLVPR